jgi:hypothetical protein
MGRLYQMQMDQTKLIQQLRGGQGNGNASPQLPDAGVLSGTPHLLSQFDSLGKTRPFGQGEYFVNQAGSWSNEITTSAQNPKLNGGLPTVIPTLWIIDGKPTRVSEDQAAELAINSGLQFPSFKTPEEAESFATQRESGWQKLSPEQSGTIPSLWRQAGQ